ncbi:amino acid ABC transporter substrate-binding protein [Pandoraea anhela]|uniref:ABC transporter n=1 Tax=Pandoraea anhela TaxID=2508295 RepID=A0A5E4W9T8_9BURK|nr:amino acid ABC transporter substrate-binding protein [Pandoraea anhela]VVE21767.1 ABC transporter [Pandoraea anhela]
MKHTSAVNSYRRHGLAIALCGALAAVGLPAMASDQDSPTLDKIRANGIITVGYRESSVPFSYLGASGKPVGFSLALCERVIDRLKTELRMPALRTTFMPVTPANRTALIQNGTVDLECGNTSVTEERARQVGFSLPVFFSQLTWLMQPDITDVDQLKGKVVVVTAGALSLSVVTRVSNERGLDLKIVQPKDHAESFLMLQSGRAAAWLDDDIVEAGHTATANPRKAFRQQKVPNGAYPYAFMLRKGDERFKSFVDGVIADDMASGAFAQLYRTWFEQPIEPKGVNLALPMSDTLKARVSMVQARKP